MLILLKIVFLFLAVWFLYINIILMIYKNRVPGANTFVMAVGIVGFIVLQFKLYL